LISFFLFLATGMKYIITIVYDHVDDTGIIDEKQMMTTRAAIINLYN